MSAELDHLVVACRDLRATVHWFADVSGVTPAPGGSHVGRGTANALVGLTGPGDLSPGYLEIIGPDPDQPDPEHARPFRVDEIEMPTLVTWAVRPDDLDVALTIARGRGYDPGGADPMSRRASDGTLLSWRLTPATFDTSGGLVPFLIDWGTTAHPATRGLPEVELLDLSAEHPDPARIQTLLSAIDVDLPVTRGDLRLSTLLRTPRGELSL